MFLQTRAVEIFDGLRKANSKASMCRCQNFLSELDKILLQNKLKNGRYARSGGFDDFEWDLKELQRQYEFHTCLGQQVSGRLLWLRLTNLKNLVRVLHVAETNIYSFSYHAIFADDRTAV